MTATLSDVNHFGEIALMVSTTRTASVRASQLSNLHKLEKETFDKVVKDHPEIAKKIKNKIKDRGVIRSLLNGF